MARPRRDDESVLLNRIASTLERRRSLDPWTLAEIAPAARLSPAGLLKRFGSRQGILLALSRRWFDSIPDGPQGRASGDELRSWVEQRFSPSGPDRVAQGLINLLDDLTDERLRELLAEGWSKEIGYVASLLDLTELPRLGDPHRGARLLFDALNGAMLRRATEADAPEPVQILDELLEVWS
ncbi:TetR/AcrR family transcriptional regulator [Sinomonas mesophila]|uniref:TetR/AcrR family transcriptional regulator n=1 Tax=Sinomonas mesophila TaxID=1531955 RepID=UPI00098455A6|nr:hypothetical protein [Sinomonas mesophila]